MAARGLESPRRLRMNEDALDDACFLDDLPRVRELLLADARLPASSCSSRRTRTRALLACFQGHVCRCESSSPPCTHGALAQLLLEAGADLNRADDQGRTVLLWLASSTGVGFLPGGQARGVRRLLAARADVQHTDQWGCSALHAACACGATDADVVRALLAAGADVNLADGAEMTALHVAAASTVPRCAHARLLLAARADVDRTDMDGQTALLVACRQGAAGGGREQCEFVSILLGAGADVNQTDLLRQSTLHVACRGGERASAALVQLLLGAHADHERCDARGETPLHCACETLALEGARALLRRAPGADVEAVRRQDESTPLLIVGLVSVETHLAEGPRDRAGEAARAFELARLLCRHGAGLAWAASDLRSRSRLAEELEGACGPTALSLWLRRAARWSTALHHVGEMTGAEALAELRAGADLRAGDGAADAPTPLALARRVLEADPRHAAASCVVAAARPWSAETHHLFPPADRARATRLLVLGHQLATDARFGGASGALRDVWVTHVMPHAVERCPDREVPGP